MAAQGRAIFISYRRDDSEGESGRLFDDLVRAYGDSSVFMDVAGIQPGLDFRKAIDDNVASCGVLLAVLGPTWATVTGSDGARRLENPNDYVRLEIGSALKRGIPVIPVLVHDAHMPPLEQLPDDLQDLRYRNSVELTHARWNSDVALLVAALKSYVGGSPAHPEETVHATIPVQLPAPQPEPADAPASKSKMPLWIGIGAAAVLLLGIGGFFLMRNGDQTQQSTVNAGTVPAGGTPATTSTASTPVPTAAAGTGAAPASGSTAVQPAASNPPQPASSSTTVASVPVPPALLGKWKISREPSGDGDDLNKVEVVDFEGKLMVQAWGKCGNRQCAWGSQRAKVVGEEAVTDTWQLRNTVQEVKLQRSAMMSLQSAGKGLQVTVKNRAHEPNGQTRDTFNQLQFVKEQ